MVVWQKENSAGCVLALLVLSMTERFIYSYESLNVTELLRENKRMLDKAIRELDRERMALQNQEKKVIAEIKKTAKQGQMVLYAKSVGFLILRSVLAFTSVLCEYRTLLRSWPSHLSGTDML